MKTLVIGASTNPGRYSFKAIKRLEKYGHEVFAIGSKIGTVGDINITTDKLLFSEIDTVVLYLSPRRQEEYYDYIISLKPKRIIFNPGTENFIFSEKARNNGIKTDNACVLVMLTLNKY